MSWRAALLLTVLAALGTRVLVFLAAAVRAFATGVPLGEAFAYVALEPITLALAQLGAVVPVLLLTRSHYAPNRTLRNALSLYPVPTGVGLLALVAGLCLAFPLAELENLLREVYPLSLEEQLRLRQFLSPLTVLRGFATVFAVCLVAPLLEELLFRGMILTGLARRHGPRVAVVLSSIYFALSHVEPVVAAYAFVAGLILSVITLRVQSVAPAIALHMGINAVPVLASPSLIRVDGLNTISEEVYHLPVTLVVGTGIVAALCIFGVIRFAEGEA